MKTEEKLVIGKPEDFVEEIKAKTQTSLEQSAFKQFWIFKCPHCNRNLVLYNAKRRREKKVEK